MDFLRSTIRLASLTLIGVLFAISWAVAANVCDPTTGTRCVTIDTNLNARTNYGTSTRTTYTASLSALTAATAHTMSIESSAGTGFKLVQWCVSLSNATAASSVAVTMNRRSTASTGGTLVTAEATGAQSVAKMDPTAGSYGGIVRLDGTLGTIGATLDQQQIQVGIIATGAGTERPFCKIYGSQGEQMPTVAAGVASGLTISVPTLGAGSLATSISATIIAE